MGKRATGPVSHAESGARADLEVDKIPQAAAGLEMERTEPGRESGWEAEPPRRSRGASGEQVCVSCLSLPGHSLIHFSLASVSVAPNKSASAKPTGDLLAAEPSPRPFAFICTGSRRPLLRILSRAGSCAFPPGCHCCRCIIVHDVSK